MFGFLATHKKIRMGLQEYKLLGILLHNPSGLLHKPTNTGKNMTTTYQEMRKKLGTRRGRKPLSAEERERRKEERKAEVRRRMEAKRRAWFVLEHKYNTEFKKIFEEEYETLKKTKKFANK